MQISGATLIDILFKMLPTWVDRGAVAAAVAIAVGTCTVFFASFLRRQLAQRTLLTAAGGRSPPGIKRIDDAMRQVTLDGRDVYISTVGSRAALDTVNVAVLFVPGMGGQAVNFFEQSSLFLPDGPLSSSAVGFFCSWPGHGLNSSPVFAECVSPDGLSKYLIEVYNWVLNQFPQNRRKSTRVVLVAHSYGCAISARTLLSMPQTSSVVFLAPPLDTESKKGFLKSSLLYAPPALLDLVRAFDRLPRGTGALSTSSVSRMVGTGVSEDMACIQLAWNGHTPSEVIQLCARQTCIPNALEYGARIRAADVPVSVICGERDQITQPSNSFQIWGASGQKARIVIAEGNVGHQVMYEAGTQVNSEIVRAVNV